MTNTGNMANSDTARGEMSSYSALDNSSHNTGYGGIDIRGINHINPVDGSGDDSDGYNGNNK